MYLKKGSWGKFRSPSLCLSPDYGGAEANFGTLNLVLVTPFLPGIYIDINFDQFHSSASNANSFCHLLFGNQTAVTIELNCRKRQRAEQSCWSGWIEPLASFTVSVGSVGRLLTPHSFCFFLRIVCTSHS
jgi:hypothetical protein